MNYLLKPIDDKDRYKLYIQKIKNRFSKGNIEISIYDFFTIISKYKILNKSDLDYFKNIFKSNKNYFFKKIKYKTYLC